MGRDRGTLEQQSDRAVSGCGVQEEGCGGGSSGGIITNMFIIGI